MTDQELAAKCGASMFAVDRASKDFMQMELVTCEPGRAVMRMTVREDMLNGHQICHGGFIFTLADSTFAFACNTYNQRTVAQQCTVTFLSPVRQGETLTAHAVERNRAGRGGIYDVTVHDSQNNVVAEFRGHSRTIAGDLLTADHTRT